MLITPETPKILQEVGLKNLPILMTQKHIRDCLHEKGEKSEWHGLTKENLLDLDGFMENPVMVFDSMQRNDVVIIVAEQVDADKLPIIVCIVPNGKGQYNFFEENSNFICSVYGRKNFGRFIAPVIANGNMLYANKEKTQNLQALSKVQFLDKFSQEFEFDVILHKSNNIVNKKSFEKPIPLKEAKKKAKESQENYQATSNATTSHSHSKR